MIVPNYYEDLHAQNGIGSNSCGPELLEQYRLDDEVIDFAIRMIPEVN